MNVRFFPAILSALAAASFVPSASAADISAGQRVYQNNCRMCHGADGKSNLPRVPDFRQPGGVLSQPDDVLLYRIEHGYKSVGSPVAMPPKGGHASLTEQDLKNVLAYMHHAFGVESESASSSSARPPSNRGNRASGSMGPGMMGNGMNGRGMMGR